MASPRSGRLYAYRIADARYSIFDGQGAALYGGRWNSPGRYVIYAAETYAEAMLEMLASANIGEIPRDQVYIKISVPKDVAIEEITAGDLAEWDAPHQEASRAYGDNWYDARRTAVLMVPSAVIRIERNIIFNQKHRAFRRITATEAAPVFWDRRLPGALP